MAIVSPGFMGRARSGPELPPGQYLEDGFPVLSAGPTPRVDTDRWEFTIHDELGRATSFDWKQLMAMPAEDITVDIHCVTRWSKLGTEWRGVSLDTVLEPVESEAEYALVRCHGGYTTNLALEDLLDGKAWIAYAYDGDALHPEHGGPARLLVPHLYLWKSAKWVRGLDLRLEDEPGFWEQAGYHDRGDPWLEQRYSDD